jgi:hypothetical protein
MKIVDKIRKINLFAKNNNNLFLTIVVLLLIIIALYRNWFLLDSAISSGDAAFRFDEYTKTLFTTYNTWLSEAVLGNPNIQIYFFPSRSLWSILSNLGFSSMAVLKFSHFLPIAIFSLISPFIFLRKATKDNFIALVGAIFYGTTTYLFATIARGHLPIACVYALSPLIFYLFILALEKNKFINWLIFILIYWAGVCYELRIMYILSFVLVVYFLFFNIFNFKKYIPNIFFIFTLLLLLNTFWLLPTLFGGIAKIIKEVATRGIFGSYLFSLTQSFTIFHFSWTGVKPTGFVLQQIPWYFWITPLSLLVLSVLLKIKKYKKYIIFFWLISLIGIFLGKQESPPLPGAYSWFYDNLPTFSLFRDGLKFYLITAIGYMGLIGYLLLLLKENKNKICSKYLFIGFSAIILLASLWNTKPLITGEIGTMFVPRHIPADYLILKDFILKQPEFFRTIWVPTDSRWGIYTNQKPKISNIFIIGNNWKNLLETYNENEKLIQNRIINVFKLSFADNLIDNSSIKYVIVPIQDILNDDDFFISYGGKENPNIRNWYISELDKIKWLKKIDIGTNELVVYENENYRPHIYTDAGLDYVGANVTEFGDFEHNQKLYLNSQIDQKSYLDSHLDNIILPVTYDRRAVDSLEKAKTDCGEDSFCVKDVKKQLDEYTGGGYLRDYKLNVPLAGVYNIYFKKENPIARSPELHFDIEGDRILRDEELSQLSLDADWLHFNKIFLEKGQKALKIYLNDQPINYLPPESIVLARQDILPAIATPKLEYRQINPTKYVVNVLGAKESFPLIFSESFHPDWKIYVQPELAGQGAGKFISENNQGTIQNENLAGGRFYDLLFRKPVLDDKHLLINGFANAWWIDINEIKNQKSKIKSYIENPDGSIDFELIIEFEPQKYFYLGLGISGATFLGCLGYLGYDWKKRRNLKLQAPNNK